MGTIKKKAKGKTAAKKSAKKSTAKGKKDLNPADVREDIAQLVKEHAKTMAGAVIGEGEKGQLAPVKYLLELAKIFPPATDGSQVSQDEDCLAKTLLDKLNIPDKPVIADQDDEEDATAIAAAPSEEKSGEPKNDDVPAECPE